MTQAYINRIATAVPDDDVHQAFVDFAGQMLSESTSPDAKRIHALFYRMAQRSGISHRRSVLTPSYRFEEANTSTEFRINAHEFYTRGRFPDTSQRMSVFERFAPLLAARALDNLRLSDEDRQGITHVVVTTCTGLYAPGLDFDIIDHLGLSSSVERTVIGFMGCYAAINGLKQARHIVRSEPKAKVLMLNLELCTLHLQETEDLEQVLSFLVFADGAAAALITAEPVGFALDSFRSVLLPETRELITWKVRGMGFDMFLSGQVPGAIGKGLTAASSEVLGETSPAEIALWAVHPGGKSVLDAVERALALDTEALHTSREILCRFGNMSSATVMFVLARLMQQAQPQQRGCAMSFGPGLTAETMLFHAV
jgi:predicted naringenin-chalcone synthase